jgi:methylated-DNA-[protein]-cysteine S-methyltransferase
MTSPLGSLFVAVSSRGLCAMDLGRSEAELLQQLDPTARLKRNSKTVEQVMRQLREYFSGARTRFEIPLDLTALTPFQREVLPTACRILPGQVRTYFRVAQAVGCPKSSRPVAQALARNPVPIVIPATETSPATAASAATAPAQGSKPSAGCSVSKARPLEL